MLVKIHILLWFQTFQIKHLLTNNNIQYNKNKSNKNPCGPECSSKTFPSSFVCFMHPLAKFLPEKKHNAFFIPLCWAMRVKLKDTQYSPYILSLTFSALSWDEYKQRQMTIIIMSRYVFINSSQREIMLHIVVRGWWKLYTLEHVMLSPMGSNIFWNEALS